MQPGALELGGVAATVCCSCRRRLPLLLLLPLLLRVLSRVLPRARPQQQAVRHVLLRHCCVVCRRLEFVDA